jgi:hypothetical protein
MRKMPNFTPIMLPKSPQDPDYRKAIKTFHEWAGSHVHLGKAGLFKAGDSGELILHELVVESICNLHVVPSEIYGSTLSYTAKASANISTSEIEEVIRVDMRVDPDEIIWITGLSAVNENLSDKIECRFQLSSEAHKLAIGSFLENNGVDPGFDVSALADAIEIEGSRLAAFQN